MILQEILPGCFYIPGANNLGIIATGDGGAIAIDTGIDKETGRTIRKALDEAKLQLRAIISTHHHADHIGGNDFLLRNIPGVELYAPPLEAALIEYPILEPSYLSMGAAPSSSLQTKWLMAKGCRVTHLIEAEELTIAGVTIEVIQLPGHSIGQIGLAYNGVCYAADGLFGASVLAKHGIPYAHHIQRQLDSFGHLAGRSDAFFLPGHGELLPKAALEEVLEHNRVMVERAAQAVRSVLTEPIDLAEAARRVRVALQLTITAAPQYAIFLSVISAHLTYLEGLGVAHSAVSEAGIVWSLVE